MDARLARGACLMLLALSACSRPQPLAPAPPRSVAGGWNRSALNVTPPVPKELAVLQPTSFIEARYQAGDASVILHVAAFSADASAFEAEQKYRPPGAVTLRQGGRLLIVRSAELRNPELIRFTKELENAWPASAQ